MKKTIVLVAKLTITIALLYFAVSRVDFDVVIPRLQRLNIVWLVVAIAALGAQAVIAAARWRFILRRCGATISRPQAVRYTFISLFFSQVLPSTVGGDAARIWLVARDGTGWPKAIYSVMIDRIAGVLALALMVIVCIPASFTIIHDPLARGALLLLGLVSMLVPLLFIGLGCRQWLMLYRIALLRHVNTAANFAYAIFSSPRSTSWIVALSLIIHGLTIAAAWLAAKSIAAPFDILHAILLIPPVLLIATAPVSIAGWGVRESAMVMAFAYSGLPQADGLLVSTLFGLATFAISVPGGLFWMRAGRHDNDIATAGFDGIWTR